VKIEDIRRILIVGAGTMGQEISLQCARYGYDVVLYDNDPAQLPRAAARHRAILSRWIAGGNILDSAAGAAISRIQLTADLRQAGQGADLLNESVPENLTLKREVLAAFNTICPAHTIFTTNTSYLLPSAMAEAGGRPELFAALHFHHEVWVSNVVDIMPHPGTADEVVELLYAFSGRIGQIPIICRREHPGYVFNAMLGALNTTAITMAANGIAMPEDIDRAWMGVMKMPIGPFGILDGVGLDTVWHIINSFISANPDLQAITNAQYLQGFLDRGFLGQKSGQGFYTYPNPAYGQPQFLKTADPIIR
jgi:3-hydroxybutyryl-CoA dehydrogenase